MALFHLRSKVFIAFIHVRSKVCKFAPHMDGSNADFAPHMEGSHADFAPHMEHRHSFRDKIIAETAGFANCQRELFITTNILPMAYVTTLREEKNILREGTFNSAALQYTVLPLYSSCSPQHCSCHAAELPRPKYQTATSQEGGSSGGSGIKNHLQDKDLYQRARFVSQN